MRLDGYYWAKHYCDVDYHLDYCYWCRCYSVGSSMATQLTEETKKKKPEIESGEAVASGAVVAVVH